MKTPPAYFSKVQGAFVFVDRRAGRLSLGGMKRFSLFLALVPAFAGAQLQDGSPYLGVLDARQAAAAEALGTARGLHDTCTISVWDGPVAGAFLNEEVGPAQPDTQSDFGRVFSFYKARAEAKYEGKALVACAVLDAGYGEAGDTIPGLAS